MTRFPQFAAHIGTAAFSVRENVVGPDDDDEPESVVGPNDEDDEDKDKDDGRHLV